MPDVTITAISDMHGYLPAPADFPGCDIALVAGDICPGDAHTPVQQRAWLQGEFARWLGSLPAAHVVGIAGNHDVVFGRDGGSLIPQLPWHYLQDSLIELCGLRIYGTPWVPRLGGDGWVFQAPRADGAGFLAERFAQIPDELDVLLAHSPPYGLCDLTMRGTHAGSRALRAAVEQRSPPLLVCGHIHEAYGTARLGATLVANVAVPDWDFRRTERTAMTFRLPAAG